MNTKMISLIATVALIAVVAVGIGYAYTAMTTNTGNNAESEYITLTQTQYSEEIDGSYNFTKDNATNTAKIYYDTINTAADTRYKLTSTTKDIVSGDTYSTVQIGKAFKLVAEPTNFTWTNNIDTLTCTFEMGGLNITTGWALFLEKEVGGNSTYFKYTGGSWSSTSFTIGETGAATKTFESPTISFYYGQMKTNVNDITDLPTTAPNQKPLDNAWIKFTASATGTNNGGTNYFVNINPTINGTISADSLIVASGGTVTITATPGNGYALGTVTVKDGSGNSVQVTNNSTFTMPASDVTVYATFVEQPQP